MFLSPQVHGVVAGGLGLALTQAARGDDLRRLTARIQTLSKKDEDSLMAHAKAMLCEEAMACALLILHVGMPCFTCYRTILANPKCVRV